MFIDNDSQGHTRGILGKLFGEDRRVKAIVNAQNICQYNSY